MMAKIVILVAALIAVCSAGLVPAVPAALTVGTYASSYNAHAINHAVAAPLVAAPAAPLAYTAPAAHYAYAAPVAHYAAPYSAAYSYHPYAAPVFAGRR